MIDHYQDQFPFVYFQYGRIDMWGTFLFPNPEVTYKYLYEWVEKYSKHPAKETVVVIGIQFICGHGMRYIERLLKKLILIHNEKYTVTIQWYFSTTSIHFDAGKHLSTKLGFPFQFIFVDEIGWYE